MLSLPQPLESELVEGCPFVKLPDPDVEVTPFLKAIFDPEFILPYPAPTEFEVIVGCVSHGHKYGVEYLLRRALVHFSSGYSTTLSQFDAYIFDVEPPQGPSWEFPDSDICQVRAIQLARQVNATWILPMAFYVLSNHLDTSDGDTIFHGALYSDVHTNLSLQDQTSFFKGYKIQCRDTAVDALGFLSNPFDIEGCLDASWCHSQRLYAINQCRERMHKRPSDFLYSWVPGDWELGLLEELCVACRTELKRTLRDAREAFWAKLPSIYGLPEWPELEEMKVVAIGTNPFG
ncbi:hypothetical protein DFH06DRAFT_1155116 [Mycena polygramma]|nr:hypothetical protein DFH06DRAFT_1155116 [Mycena polygramma]